MAYYLNYDALCKALHENARGRCLAYGWFDEFGEGYQECIIDVEDFEVVDAVEVVRCGDCQIKPMCRYAVHLGDSGFCSQGIREEE